MNPKRLVLAIAAVFVAIFLTDYLIHEVWLKSTYQQTPSLWRPAAEMASHFGWLVLGQFLMAVTFVALYARGFAARRCLLCAGLYGLLMGVFFEANTLITYTVQPFPGLLAAQWFVANAARGLLLGLLAFVVYQPKPEPAESEK